MPSKPEKSLSSTAEHLSLNRKKISPKRKSPIIRKRQSNTRKAFSLTASTTSSSPSHTPPTLTPPTHTYTPPTHTPHTDPAENDDTLTNSMLDQNKTQKSIGIQSVSSDISSSHTHNQSMLSTEMESLLATALLNAQQTLQTIKTFSQNIGSSQINNTLLNSVNHQTKLDSICNSSLTGRLKLSSHGSLSERKVGQCSGNAVTSTPYVRSGRNRILSQCIESPLDNSIGECLYLCLSA